MRSDSDRSPSTPDAPTATHRRRFLQLFAVAAVGGRTLLRSGDARAAVDAAREAASDTPWPTMTRRTLGRTGWTASRPVFGCGAALSRQRRDDLLEAALAAGISVFDVGFRGYYRDAEQNLAPFLQKHRDEIRLISKAMAAPDLEADEPLSAARRKELALAWSQRLDESLVELGVERVDAYYLMAANNAALVASDELRRAFERARDAGKVEHLGLSTHENAERVLTAAADAGHFSLAQIAITPAGWYDWTDKGILAGTRTMAELQPTLARARAAGIGLIGMKAGRYLAGRKFLGWGKPDAFDAHYDAAFLASGLSPYQRSYAYVLGHGLDAVNADMQSFAHLRENAEAAVSADRWFA
jgi:aryl-alcohol dehydrogenase-like predicted oxidoreductase